MSHALQKLHAFLGITPIIGHINSMVDFPYSG
jgi:hypothetical protein